MTENTSDARNSHIRFWIIAVLFIVSSINYASRASMGIAGNPLTTADVKALAAGQPVG